MMQTRLIKRSLISKAVRRSCPAQRRDSIRWRRRPRKRDSSERIFPLPSWERARVRGRTTVSQPDRPSPRPSPAAREREKREKGEERVTQTSQLWTESFVEVAGGKVHLLKGGAGEPLLILHRDVGNPVWLPFYEDLAQRFTVYVP